jgi:protocatechuate 3,4-dioxygenase beta subunit
MKTRVLIILLIAILAIAATGSAKGPIGALAGTVLDAAGNPVPAATVTLQTSDGNHPHLTRTDADGHFQFTRFETGQYDVRAQSKGLFSDWLKRIYIHANKTTQVTLHLPSPPSQ